MIRTLTFLLLYLVVNSVSMGQSTTVKSHRNQFLMSYGPSYTTLFPDIFIDSHDPEIASLDISATYGTVLHFEISRRFSKNIVCGFSFSRQQHSAKINRVTDFTISFTDYQFIAIKDYYQLFIGHKFCNYFDASMGVGLFFSKQPKIIYMGNMMYDLQNSRYLPGLFFSINMGYMYPLDRHVELGIKARYYKDIYKGSSAIDAFTVQPSIQILF